MTKLPQPEKFKTSHLKVDRAKRHLEELRSEVDRYLSSAPAKLVWERVPWIERYDGKIEPGANICGLVTRVQRRVPDHLAPIIGDVVHNLRSALDIMICDLVLAASPGEDIMRVQFPCWKKPQDKKDAIKKSKVEKVGAVPIGLVDAWEPFKGGASRLWALSELNNLDKHRALIPTMIGVEFSESYALLANEIPLDDFIDPFPARKMAIDGKPFISCLLESSPPVGTDVPCVCHLGLDGVEDIKGHGLLDELQWQVDTVHCVLLSFELGIEPEFKARETRKPVYTGNGIWLGPPEMRSDQVIKYVMTQQATAGGKAEGT